MVNGKGEGTYVCEWERGAGGQVEDICVCKHTFLERRGVTTKPCCGGIERVGASVAAPPAHVPGK